MAWTTLEVLDWTSRRFAEKGIDAARLEAQVLIAHALSCTKVQLYTGFDKPLAETELAKIRELVRRRLGGEPVAYLVGEQEFWSLPFWVTEEVLVPRRDSETVIEAVLDSVADRAAALRVADIATGSGILAVTLARELGNAQVVASDLSPAAVALARRNAERNQVAERVEVRVGDLLASLGAERFDVVVSNPPYVRSAELASLAADVQREPRLALDGGGDGLDLIRRLAKGISAHLAPGGRFFVEHGFDQAAEVAALLETAGLSSVSTRRDLAGHPRVTWGRLATS